MAILTLKADSGSWTEAFDQFHDGQVTIDVSQLPSVLLKFFADNVLMKPFAGYRNFDACVRTVSHRKHPPSDPNAYCASIMHQVEGGKKANIVGKIEDFQMFHKYNNFIEGKDVVFGIEVEPNGRPFAKAVIVYANEGVELDEKCACMKTYVFESMEALDAWISI